MYVIWVRYITPVIFRLSNSGEEKCLKLQELPQQQKIDRHALEVINALSPFDFHVLLSSRYVSKLFLLHQ